MAALGQAALSVDSPDHSAAQVLAFMHGPEAESTENSAVATAKPKGAGGGTTSREDMPLATLQDNNERDSVVKIVWTAEEDQQLLQVPPQPPVSPLMTTEWKRLWETKTTDAPSVG